MESLELRAVSRNYTDAHGAPFRALDAVSLSWRQGDAIAIMGESGVRLRSASSTLRWQDQAGLSVPLAS